MRRRLFLVLAIALFRSASAGGALDGRIFDVTLERAGGGGPTSDRLVFADGMLDSTAGHAWGFTKAAYTSTLSGKGTRFEARAASATHGTMEWLGEIRGVRIEGTMEWEDGGGKSRYTVAGRTLE